MHLWILKNIDRSYFIQNLLYLQYSMYSGQGFTCFQVWRMKQDGGMRVADQHTF